MQFGAGFDGICTLRCDKMHLFDAIWPPVYGARDAQVRAQDLPDTGRMNFRQLAPAVDLLTRLMIAQPVEGDSGPATPASQGIGAEPGLGRSSTSVSAEGETSGSDSTARAG